MNKNNENIYFSLSIGIARLITKNKQSTISKLGILEAKKKHIICKLPLIINCSIDNKSIYKI